jgi:hypothetical protein
MISLNTWDVLFEGKYGSQELSLLYKDDYFVSFLRSRDKKDILVQVYKLFAVYGDVEIFAETLPSQCIVYEKHFDIGEKNTHKFFIINTETEYVDNNTLSYHVDKKINELNKKTSTLVSVMKSYNLKLISLKNLSQNIRNYFFNDPFIIKTLTNMPMSADLSGVTSIDKLLLGKKNNIPINTTLENLRSVFVSGAEEDDRLFVLKLISEIYLLSSKTVIVFDKKGVFKSLAYPQQNEDLLQEFDSVLGAFGFPSKYVDYFTQIKIPLGSIPKQGFISQFKFTDVGEKIINNCFKDSLVVVDDLIENVLDFPIDDEITEFEKKRVVSKLRLIDKKYSSYFGKIDVSFLFENKYKHLGYSKILKINYDCPFYAYYVKKIIEELSLNVKNDLLLVLPESENIFNHLFVGDRVSSIIQENPKLNVVISTEFPTNIKNKEYLDIFVGVIGGNDVVIRYPNRDPLRIMLRPTLSSSNVVLKKSENV